MLPIAFDNICVFLITLQSVFCSYSYCADVKTMAVDDGNLVSWWQEINDLGPFVRKSLEEVKPAGLANRMSHTQMQEQLDDHKSKLETQLAVVHKEILVQMNRQLGQMSARMAGDRATTTKEMLANALENIAGGEG